MSGERALSRYATREEALSEPFMEVNQVCDRINGEFGLADFTSDNRDRYPWATCLNYPEFYASRLWEYPWAILESGLEPGMRCADIGCGEMPFAIYLKEVAGCDVIGFDREVGTSPRPGWGVSKEFATRTGIEFVRSNIDSLEASTDCFDRVFCISVIEHIPPPHSFEGMREIARILKPGGLALITVDINLEKRIVAPLHLIWESGLSIYGGIDLTMPCERFAIYVDGKQSQDVFGFVLQKPASKIKTNYRNDAPLTQAWRACYLRDTFPPEHPPSPLSLKMIRHDLKRNTKNGRPTYITLLRIAGKFLLRRYPETK